MNIQWWIWDSWNVDLFTWLFNIQSTFYWNCYIVALHHVLPIKFIEYVGKSSHNIMLCCCSFMSQLFCQLRHSCQIRNTLFCFTKKTKRNTMVFQTVWIVERRDKKKIQINPHFIWNKIDHSEPHLASFPRYTFWLEKRGFSVKNSIFSLYVSLSN